MEGGPEGRQRSGRASSGTAIACQTISLAEDWRKGGFGTGGQGSNVTPLSPVAGRARSAANVFAVLREHSRRRYAG